MTTRDRHRKARLVALAAAAALLLTVTAAVPALGGSTSGPSAARQPVKVSEFVLVTGKALGSRTKSVTIHVYDARSRKALGSVCLQPSDQTAISTRANSRKAIFVGATENRRSCADPRVANPERRGTPRPDRRYSRGCFQLRAGNLRIVRYPDDLTASKRPRCLPARPAS